MKIILTLNELKAGGELMKRIGLSASQLERVISMKDESTVNAKALAEEVELNFSPERLAMLNKNPDVLTVSKYNNSTGTTIYSFTVSEEFVIDSTIMYGGLVEVIFNSIKGAVKSILSFVKTDATAFASKWKLK